MKMGSVTVSFASILANDCRSLSSPVTLVRTLATTLVALSKHHNKHLVAWSSGCSTSNTTAFACEYSKPDVTHTATTTSVNGYPEYHRLLPCPSHNGPPRVEHLVISEGGPVLEYICKALDLPPLFVADLIHFGAVYYALVCPKPPPSATPEQIQIFEEVTAPSKTFRITHVDQFVEAGTYIRVHVHPKRFPRCYEIDWKSRIIAVTESYVVLDKPAGTSVGGTTDNIEESCATFATRALGLTIPLKTTHQIDNSRTKEYCSVFHGKIRKKVKKLYLALAAAPVPIGIITHYMRPINMAPRLISEDSILSVLYGTMWCGLTPKLLWHIRAQLAACGAPMVGDSMYMPAAIAEMRSPGCNPFGKYKQNYTNETDKEMAVTEWIAQHGKEPNVAIGLQACQISWDDGEHMYEAGSPWWRFEIA
ncbi:RNA pseudouridine synthase 6, chloroplastic isoform X1 [Fagus crenata]